MIEVRSVRFALGAVSTSTGFDFSNVLSACGSHRMRISAHLIESGRKMHVFVETTKGVSCYKLFTPPQSSEKSDFEVLVNLYKIRGDLSTKSQIEKHFARHKIVGGEQILECFLARALERNEILTVVSAPRVQDQIVSVGYGGPTLNLSSIGQGRASFGRVPGALVIPDIVSAVVSAIESEWW